MRIAIVHYHLKRGGVTRVVENTVPSLLNHGHEVVILASDASGLGGDFPAPVRKVPELAYQTGSHRVALDVLEDSLREQALSALGQGPDVWHIHNHHLAKNTTLTRLVAKLAEDGERLLLHIHDFPEDGRAGNYDVLRTDLGSEEQLRRYLYPVAPTVYYGLLNRRDVGAMIAAGVPEDRIRLLPNPIVGAKATREVTPLPEIEADRLFLYPTRAIRRKNLGEFLLWAAMANSGDKFACTLAPDNPTARPMYDRWVQFADELKLPVEFELGNRTSASFEDLVAGSDGLLTTSVAEGFGLAYLEPWLFNRRLVGRNLPLITSDFVEAGVDLDGLYDLLAIPLEWLDTVSLKRELSVALTRVYQQYGVPLDPDLVEATWFGMTREGQIDFGRLPEGFQETVIRRVMLNPGAVDTIQPSRLVQNIDATQIERNRTTIAEQFGVDGYYDRLNEIYQQLARATFSKPQWVDPDRVLKQFLNPAFFTFLRT